MKLTARDRARLWSKIRKGGGPRGECWEWQAALNDGYGAFVLRRRKWLVHRLVFALVHGEEALVTEGGGELVVRHTCDNRLCCNPAHLIPGSRLDNVRDMCERGRRRGGWGKGERNVRAVLTEGQVRDALELYASGRVSLSDLSVELGVSARHVWRIVQGIVWGDVVDDRLRERCRKVARARKAVAGGGIAHDKGARRQWLGTA
jgi:hypothetical protein